MTRPCTDTIGISSSLSRLPCSGVLSLCLQLGPLLRLASRPANRVPAHMLPQMWQPLPMMRTLQEPNTAPARHHLHSTRQSILEETVQAPQTHEHLQAEEQMWRQHQHLPKLAVTYGFSTALGHLIVHKRTYWSCNGVACILAFLGSSFRCACVLLLR